MAYKLSIMQGNERWIVSTSLSVNLCSYTRHTVTFGTPINISF
jgi:hypothetical protein